MNLPTSLIPIPVAFLLVCLLAHAPAVADEDVTGRGIAAYRQGNFDLAFRSWSLAAEAGDRLAQFNLGNLYARGEGVPKNIGRAMYWYRKAAERGYPKAMYSLGEAYRTGTGVRLNADAARQWFLKAAAAGDAQARTMLGKTHENGSGSAADIEQAVRWYRAAADANDAEGEMLLATMYESGKGVPRDPAIARVLLTDAAEQGNATAQLLLADQWLNGRGGAVDKQEAVFWLARAARQGVAAAFSKLARLYETDTQVGGNAAAAYASYLLAARLDDKNSLRGRPAAEAERIRAHLDAAPLQTATELAARWKIGDAPPRASAPNPPGDADAVCTHPAYPDEARAYELEGTTAVRFRVTADGEAVELHVVQSSGWMMLDAAVTAAISKCAFKPAVRDGAAVDSWSIIQHFWRLDDVAQERSDSPPHLVDGSCHPGWRVEVAAPTDAAAVKYRFLTTPGGQAMQIRSERRAPDPEADAPAKAFLSSCRFHPAMKNGVPVAGASYLRIRPSLQPSADAARGPAQSANSL